jgi:nucleoside-diphosphate-sugar epimerase
VGGSEEISANQVIAILEELIGRPAIVEHGPARPGEQSRALANTTLPRERLVCKPQGRLREGLAARVAWQRAQPPGG